MRKILFSLVFLIFYINPLYSQSETHKVINVTNNSNQDSSDGKISFKDIQGNVILEINEEEGGASISLPPLSAIGNNLNKIYNLGNMLYWENNPIGQSNVGNGWMVQDGNIVLSDSNNFVGIGTGIPTQKLHIENGNILVRGNVNWFPGLTILNEVGRSVLQLRGTTSSNNFSSAQIVLEDLTNGHTWNLLNNTNTFTLVNHLNGTNYLSPLKIEFGAPDNSLTINSEGNVGIGAWSNVHKLAVAGSIISEEIVVKLQTNWPDFVFDKDYELPNLKELENYINTNHHLKGIPTASDIQNNGINIGEIQIKLLQKIEELTLYLIKQDKNIKILTQQVEDLQKVVGEPK